MRTLTIYLAAMLLALAGGMSPAMALTQEELVAKIQAAGYSQVTDVKSTAEGTTVKAGEGRQAGEARRRQQRPDQRAKLSGGRVR